MTLLLCTVLFVQLCICIYKKKLYRTKDFLNYSFNDVEKNIYVKYIISMIYRNTLTLHLDFKLNPIIKWFNHFINYCFKIIVIKERKYQKRKF